MKKYDDLYNKRNYLNDNDYEDNKYKNNKSNMVLYSYKKDLERKIIEEDNTIYEVDYKCIDAYRDMI